MSRPRFYNQMMQERNTREQDRIYSNLDESLCRRNNGFGPNKNIFPNAEDSYFRECHIDRVNYNLADNLYTDCHINQGQGGYGCGETKDSNKEFYLSLNSQNTILKDKNTIWYTDDILAHYKIECIEVVSVEYPNIEYIISTENNNNKFEIYIDTTPDINKVLFSEKKQQYIEKKSIEEILTESENKERTDLVHKTSELKSARKILTKLEEVDSFEKVGLYSDEELKSQIEKYRDIILKTEAKVEILNNSLTTEVALLQKAKNDISTLLMDIEIIEKKIYADEANYVLKEEFLIPEGNYNLPEFTKMLNGKFEELELELSIEYIPANGKILLNSVHSYMFSFIEDSPYPLHKIMGFSDHNVNFKKCENQDAFYVISNYPVRLGGENAIFLNINNIGNIINFSDNKKQKSRNSRLKHISKILMLANKTEINFSQKNSNLITRPYGLDSLTMKKLIISFYDLNNLPINLFYQYSLLSMTVRITISCLKNFNPSRIYKK